MNLTDRKSFTISSGRTEGLVEGLQRVAELLAPDGEWGRAFADVKVCVISFVPPMPLPSNVDDSDLRAMPSALRASMSGSLTASIEGTPRT